MAKTICCLECHKPSYDREDPTDRNHKFCTTCQKWTWFSQMCPMHGQFHGDPVAPGVFCNHLSVNCPSNKK